MDNWIIHPTVLNGSRVTLLPLEVEHIDILEAIAKDDRIWQHYSYNGANSASYKNNIRTALEDRNVGKQYPFAIFHKTENRLIGSTRFHEIHFHHRKLEIGGTWLHPDYWGSGINVECKLLLLQFCFETLEAYRVQLKTDVLNTRSWKAIEKIGGNYEGSLRNDMVREDGSKRTSAYFGFYKEEWPEKKLNLQNLLSANLLT